VCDFVLRIRNDFDELPAAAGAATLFLENNGASPEVIFAANLAIEEIVTNTIKYAYSDARRHEITIHLWLVEKILQIEISDDGNEFDPFSQPEANICLPPQERQIGGLGIHFVRNMLDSCAYVRSEGRNVLKLSKRL
jgi:serine/threonine-protein kinase RsbW